MCSVPVASFVLGNHLAGGSVWAHGLLPPAVTSSAFVTEMPNENVQADFTLSKLFNRVLSDVDGKRLFAEG